MSLFCGETFLYPIVLLRVISTFGQSTALSTVTSFSSLPGKCTDTVNWRSLFAQCSKQACDDCLACLLPKGMHTNLVSYQEIISSDIAFRRTFASRLRALFGRRGRSTLGETPREQPTQCPITRKFVYFVPLDAIRNDIRIAHSVPVCIAVYCEWKCPLRANLLHACHIYSS